uniref:C2 domain-containing protein n=1 Tax=Setaria digitata TaxID=48799 RepID=A0A915PHH5_9BILA
MDGLTWLIVSWLVVGVMCYFMLTKVGVTQTSVNTGISGTTNTPLTSSSKWKNEDYSTDWLNDIIGWLFSNMHRVPDILQSWITAMNEAAKKISSPGKSEVLFEGFADNKNVTRAPRITNVCLQQAPNDHLIIKGKISIPEVNLKLMSSQRTGDRLLVTNYDAKVTDLHGEIELRLACIANQVYMMACFCGRPELDIELINRDQSSTGNASNAMVDEMIRKCLLSAVTNVSLTEIGGQCGRITTGTVPPGVFPVNSHPIIATGGDGSGVIDSNANMTTISAQAMLKRFNQPTQPANHITNLSPTANKMRVKVIRAQRLGGDRSVNQPYVVLEMDEPAQKFRTTSGLNMSPYWEESFDFNLTSASEEILFEIYEDANTTITSTGRTGYLGHGDVEEDRFLGLAIVSLEEVRRSSANIAHTLKLQGRPYRNDVITGSLSVQFEFYYDPVIPPLDKEINQSSVRNNQFRETTSSTKRPIYDPRDSFGAYDSPDRASAKTTTVTVKTVSQQPPDDKTQPLTSTSGITVVQQTSTTPIYNSYEQRIGTTDLSYGSTVHQPSTGYGKQQEYVNTSRTTTQGQQQEQQQQQHQPGSITSTRIQQHVIPGSSSGVVSGNISHAQHFSSIRSNDHHIDDADRYPYQKYNEEETEILMKGNKSKITDEISPVDEITEVRQSRGEEKMHGDVKAARKRDRSFFSELRDRLSGRRRSKRRAKSCDLGTGDMEEAVSLPPSRDPSRTRFSEKSGSRHDLASYGGKSERSIKSLYQHSTLVLETYENGQKRYYLIPPSILDESGATKLLRQGKKLHIYNDHTFVAVKTRSGTVCSVCHQRIGRSNFTKQAYQCRGDCNFIF